MGYHQEKHSDSELSSDHPTPLSYLSSRSQMRFSKQEPSVLSSAVSFSTPVVEALHLVNPCTAQGQQQLQLRWRDDSSTAVEGTQAGACRHVMLELKLGVLPVRVLSNPTRRTLGVREGS